MTVGLANPAPWSLHLPLQQPPLTPLLVATLRSTLPLVPRLDELRILLLDGSNTASLLGSCLCLRSVLGVLQALGDADIDLMGGSRLMR